MWYYNKKQINGLADLPLHEGPIGFVYKITHLESGKFYIGRKVLITRRKARISATEKKKTGTRKTFKLIEKESNWMVYYGSCDQLNSDVKSMSATSFKREILELCCSKKYMNYCEVYWQMKLDVLRANSYNGNVLGKYYQKDMDNCKPAVLVTTS
jgi:hypothetical protein